MGKKRSFNLRSFTSFSLVISTIIMSWSGFILYVAPPGRIANWSDWELMLFTKAEWQALHTIFSYMFFILFVIHLFFVNWKAFLTYFSSKIKKGLKRKWELSAALVVSAIFFIGTLESWTPFGPVMTFGERVKESWDKNYSAPPVAHMEDYSIDKIAADFPGITPDQIVKTLADSGIKVTTAEETLKNIAVANNVTPSRIYEILTSKYKNQQVENKGAPSGVGKLTVKAVAERLGKSEAEILQILSESGINAKPETTMKEISEQLGISPHDIYSSFAGK
jgi:hypothetical protein